MKTKLQELAEYLSEIDPLVKAAMNLKVEVFFREEDISTGEATILINGIEFYVEYKYDSEYVKAEPRTREHPGEAAHYKFNLEIDMVKSVVFVTEQIKQLIYDVIYSELDKEINDF